MTALTVLENKRHQHHYGTPALSASELARIAEIQAVVSSVHIGEFQLARVAALRETPFNVRFSAVQAFIASDIPPRTPTPRLRVVDRAA